MNRIVERRADVSKIIDDVERDKRNAVIEECARVAECCLDDTDDYHYGDVVAAAIRALKDKP